MRILFTSDIHAGPTLLAQLMDTVAAQRVAAVIIGGDLIPHHLPQPPGRDILCAQAVYLEREFIPAFRELRSQLDIPVYLDMGNDDFAANRTILEAVDGSLFHLLHMRRCRLTREVDLVGYMVVPPTPFYRKDWEKPDRAGRPVRPGNRVITHGQVTWGGVIEDMELDLASGDTIAADLAILSEGIRKPFILVSHSPPADTPLDITSLGVHVGSQAIRDFIAHWAKRGMLPAALHGHIHESYRMSGTIRTRISGALCVNPGQDHGPDAVLRYVILELNKDGSTPMVRIAA